MKKIILSLITCALSVQFSFSQGVDNSDGFNVYDATKPVTILESILFGKLRIIGEYIYAPSFDDDDVLALRIIKNLYFETYMLQVFRLSDSQQKMREIYQASSTTTPELYKKYSPKPRSVEISEQFATKLNEKMIALIREYRPRVTTPGIIESVGDGIGVTFRVVEGKDLLARRIHIPRNRAKQLSDICNQIITDVRKRKTLNEAKYIKLLNEIDL